LLCLLNAFNDAHSNGVMGPWLKGASTCL
jgi:hypothetical protein